jgi:hypothetical protein
LAFFASLAIFKMGISSSLAMTQGTILEAALPPVRRQKPIKSSVRTVVFGAKEKRRVCPAE